MYRVLPKLLGIVATFEEVELGWPFAEATTLVGKMLTDFSVEIHGTDMSEEEMTYHLECKPAVTAALAPVRLSLPWQQVRDGISEALISKLQGADIALRRFVNEQLLIEADLKELRTSVQAALDSISASELPQELKSFIAMNLLRIRAALDEYEFRGLSGLQDALAGYLGSLARANEQIAEHATEPQKKSLAEVLSIANAAVTLAHGAAWIWPTLHSGLNAVAGLLT